MVKLSKGLPDIMTNSFSVESLLSSSQALFSAALCCGQGPSVVLTSLTSSICRGAWMGVSTSLSLSCTFLLKLHIKK